MASLLVVKQFDMLEGFFPNKEIIENNFKNIQKQDEQRVKIKKLPNFFKMDKASGRSKKEAKDDKQKDQKIEEQVSLSLSLSK